MYFPSRHIKVLTIVLLLVQLCLPLSGPRYVSDFLSNRDENHPGLVCAHADADSGHKSQGSHQQIPHCHELDAPCETTAGYALKHSPVIAALAAADNGALLPGYGLLIDIPPENRASYFQSCQDFAMNSSPAGLIAG